MLKKCAFGSGRLLLEKIKIFGDLTLGTLITFLTIENNNIDNYIVILE